MATVLQEEQWEVIPNPDILGEGEGIVFGNGTPNIVLADGLDYGASEARVQDVERPHGDGLLMGRDYYTPPEWSLTIGVGAMSHTDVWGPLYRLQQAWRADGTRSEPGALSVLRFRRRGVTYRVLGRPRKFGIQPGNRKNDEFQTVVATFQLADSEYYIEADSGSANRNRLVLRQTGPPIMTGMRFPSRFPWRFGGSATGTRSGVVTVGGFLSAPFTATIFGPPAGTTASGFRLSGDGWEIKTSATLAYDRSLIIRTAQATITDEGGNSLAGTLSRRSRLTARLRPGQQQIKFEVDHDPTGSSYAVIDFYDTVPA